MWSNPGPRAAAVPPFDRDEHLREMGVVDALGAPTAFGSIWLEQTHHEREQNASDPWPEHIDADDYYANLPDSLHELRAAWERGSREHPSMLRLAPERREITIMRCFHRGLCGFPLLTGDAPMWS